MWSLLSQYLVSQRAYNTKPLLLMSSLIILSISYSACMMCGYRKACLIDSLQHLSCARIRCWRIDSFFERPPKACLSCCVLAVYWDTEFICEGEKKESLKNLQAFEVPKFECMQLQIHKHEMQLVVLNFTDKHRWLSKFVQKSVFLESILQRHK